MSRTSHSRSNAVLSMIANLITHINRYVENGEWYLLGVRSQRNVMTYDCCEGKFPDVTYHLELRRRTLFYLMNFILPCVLIAVLTLLVFLLPPESGERMSFGVTVLLSFTILLLMLMVGVKNMCCKLVPQDPLGFDKGGFIDELDSLLKRRKHLQNAFTTFSLIIIFRESSGCKSFSSF